MSSAAASKVIQPKWFKPSPKNDQNKLKLYNTLTRTKEVFVPLSGTNTVSWYSCGPTVYDASHMGHARNYVSIDINRRILQNYFNYDINFVQNVTDIDDKIIIRARQNYLFENFVNDNATINDEIINKIEKSLFIYINKNFTKVFDSNVEKINTIVEFQNFIKSIDQSSAKQIDPKFPMHLTATNNTITALNDYKNIPIDTFYTLIKDILVPILDEELGSKISDPEIFSKLPSFWEKQFDQDMRNLNVLPPTSTTRVSEYVPEIVEFVKKIIDNGFAYPTTDGSVYFDTVKFDSSSNHDYAKLQPWNKGQLDLINDAEGSLTKSYDDKKSKNDFALWKSSKPGEPKWNSPWGYGRPGWHIECSVMASDALGPNIDIHSGGIDLAFPHHDNELAQSEAHFNNDQWINYFLHTGHLHIEGQKMSKSLKNFITINEALEKYSPRQLRLAFAFVQWNNQLDFKEALIHEVKSFETTLNNFFTNIRAFNNDYKHLVETTDDNVSKKFSNLEKELTQYLTQAQQEVHSSFCDNLATSRVLKTLSDLVTNTNNYITKVEKNWRIEPLLSVTKYITKILGIIGFPIRADGLGWENSSSSSSDGTTASTEEVILPYVKCLSKFRDEVRKLSIQKKPYQDFLKLSDVLRDNDLLNLNISLDDRNNQAALIKILTDEEKEKLITFNAEKAQREAEKLAKKLEQKRLNDIKEQERREKAKLKPEDMFKTDERFTAWDENGMPTKDKEGNDVSKSMLKKLKKQWDQQKKLHDEFSSA